MSNDQFTLRLEPELVADLKHAANVEGLDGATMARKLLMCALREWRVERALQQYQRDEISIGRACEDARLSHHEMLDLVRGRGIAYPLPGSDLLDRMDEILATLPPVTDRPLSNGAPD